MSQMMYYLSVAIIIAAPVTGIILLIDKLFFVRRRKKDQRLPFWVDWSAFLFPVVLFVAILRSFVAEFYVIPTGSMQPTLYGGDMIVANKWSFGIRYPIINTRIFSEVGEGVNRGDIAIFRYPEDTSINYIKRIIGIPGDTIDYKNKQLIVNGVPVQLERVGQAEIPTRDIIATEHLPSQTATVIHEIQYTPSLIPQSDFGVELRFPFTVPEGQYFVMGDNRDNSQDSRFWGFVPDNYLLGKANMIWMNYNCVFKLKDCDHIGTILK